jgi:putative spermidine/putrescine transport system substrate-binding protein
MRRSLPALSRRQFLAGAAGSAVAALLAACGGSTATDTPKPAAPTTAPTTAAAVTNAPTAAPTTAPAAATAPAATTAASSTTTGTRVAGSAVATTGASGTTAAGTSTGSTTLGGGTINGMTWDQILAKAKGGTANWFLYGGSQTTNDYLDKYVAPKMKELYGVTLQRTPVTDTVDAVNKVLAEKQAGKTTDGSVDMIWINGENFRTMANADILYPGWARNLPNAKLISWEEPQVANDFGVPVNDREAPWARAQFVFVYDSAKVPTPPKSFKALEDWLKANPGKFTYAAPPDFTGSVFVRHVLYETTGGWQQYGNAINEQVYTAKSPAAWEYLNRIKPNLWQKGATYPEGAPKLDQLFADGEVSFTMSYSPTAGSVGIGTGKFPKTTRTFYLDAGTIANTSYITIPFNAKNKEAALVLANFLESPEAQLEKAKQTLSGDSTVLDLSRLSDADRAAFKAIPLDPATIPSADLAAHAVPELPSAYVDRIEKDWTANVLKK